MVSLLVIRRIAWLRSTQRNLKMGLAFSAISKYIEMYTSAVVEVGKSVGGGVGWRTGCPGLGD